MNNPFITAPVGRGGKNKPIDVAVIESLFHAYYFKYLVTLRRKLSQLTIPKELPLSKLFIELVKWGVIAGEKSLPTYVNGIIGTGSACLLCQVIETFQKEVVKITPDGRVDPNGLTLKKLIQQLPNKKGHPRDIIFGQPLLHTNILAKINQVRFKQFFLKYYPLKKTKEDLNGFLDYIKNDTSVQDVRWAAYMLATAYHETAFTFLPIEEYGKGVGYEYGKKIKVIDTEGIRGEKNKEYENSYYGRGYVQLTWATNYKNMGKKLGLADTLYIDPDKALEPQTAYNIISYGMRNGSFTGKKLSDYIEKQKCDYFNARKIVNGLDKAKQIAKYAETIELLLRLCAR